LSNLLRKEKRGTAQDSSVSHNRPASKNRVPGPVPVRERPSAHQSQLDAQSGDALRVPIHSYEDILEARQRGRELAAELGFPSIDCTLVATAISELARNIVLYAGHGEIRLSRDERLGLTGIVITAADRGPGIRDLRSALQEGYSTSRGLGLGLPGVKRIMDEFDIHSKPRQGVTVTVKKWKAN
jgi:serine/threonine-protein kinase RsbT